jgi:uncharacterized membrane protein (UPF0136 family)
MAPGLIIALIYGILAIVGGIVGYKQAGSQMSLFSGIISGILLILGVILATQGNGAGIWLARGVSLLLVVVFVGRLLKTKKMMPAGLMVSAGIVTLLALSI